MRASAIISLVCLLATQRLLGEENQPRLVVDLSAPRAEIRAMLLNHTPVGSSIKQVEEFISRQLQRSEEISVVTAHRAQEVRSPRARKKISVTLGHYYQHLGAVFLTAPMIVHKEVSAQWWFNSHDRLTEISVDKRTRVY